MVIEAEPARPRRRRLLDRPQVEHRCRSAPTRRAAKYLVCNADEMEPGSFKDRFLMERNPHLLLEGMLLAAYATQADAGLHLPARGVRPAAGASSTRPSPRRAAAGYLGGDVLGSGWSFDILTCTRAPAATSAARRRPCSTPSRASGANPRARPPHMTGAGLWAQPTVVNNVETFCCRAAHRRATGRSGGKGLGRTDEGGTKIYGVAGRVKRPAAGSCRWARRCASSSRARRRHARRLRACAPSSPAAPPPPSCRPTDLDVAMDFDVDEAGRQPPRHRARWSSSTTRPARSA